jgi:hypothetical protein
LASWSNPLVNPNPKCHLSIHHSCHNEWNLVFLKTLDSLSLWCAPPTCVPSHIIKATYKLDRIFLWCVSCQNNGQFLSMWHNRPYWEHNEYIQHVKAKGIKMSGGDRYALTQYWKQQWLANELLNPKWITMCDHFKKLSWIFSKNI